MRRVAIGDYGLIGDTRSAALVAPDGSIDWWCVPRFDDPPLFGRLVGGDDGGWFTLGPDEPARVLRRAYRPDTATLTTTWALDGGQLELSDGLVAEVGSRFLPGTVSGPPAHGPHAAGPCATPPRAALRLRPPDRPPHQPPGRCARVRTR